MIVLEVVLHEEKSKDLADITPREDGSGSCLGEIMPEDNISFQKAG